MQNQYNLSRKTASKLLKISLRTVDRYVKDKKLSTRAVDGRIWLDRAEVDQFVSRQSVDMSTSKLSIDRNVDKVDKSVDRVDSNVDKVDSDIDKVDKIEILNQESVDPLSTPKKRSEGEDATYKKLYSEMKEEIREKQGRLEVANYRVGQLETQLKNSIPMLEYQLETHEKKKTEEKLKSKLDESSNIIRKLCLKLKHAKLNKRILLIILLTILVLQPLWLLLIYK